ncbi:MAG: protein translocase subunit SecD [Candidatus Eremiobacterota bacterium]
MDFLRWDTPLQAVTILLITLLCVYFVFLQPPKNTTVALEVEFKDVNFITNDDIDTLLKPFGLEVDREKGSIDNTAPQYVSGNFAVRSQKDVKKNLADIDSKAIENSFKDYFGRVQTFSYNDATISVQIEKTLALDRKLRKALEDYKLSNSFISHDSANILKITINAGKIPAGSRAEIEKAFKEKIGSLVSFKATEKGTRVKLGLDLRSGTHLRLQLLPNPEVGIKEITPQIMEQTIMVLDKRINELGTFEPIIQPQGDNSIIVDLPEVQDPQAAIEIIQKSAFLEFKEQSATDPSGWKTVMTGDKIKGAQMSLVNGPHVGFELTPEGSKQFAEITERNIKKPIAIFFDGELISAPVVQNVISTGSGQITMGGGGDLKKSEEEALSLARYLRAGALPVPLKIVENQLVGPTLGKESLEKSLHAGIIGLAVICIFMVFVYRVPGFLADMALIFYALILMACFTEYGFVLTLPGIAGFILSIGMAVDANVLIFERLREELWDKKEVPQAISTAFHRAWSAVLDSHVTTFIGAVVMYYYGSSSVKGFGLTLALGTFVSLITAVFVTRVFVDLVSKNKIVTSRWLYGE